MQKKWPSHFFSFSKQTNTMNTNKIKRTKIEMRNNNLREMCQSIKDTPATYW